MFGNNVVHRRVLFAALAAFCLGAIATSARANDRVVTLDHAMQDLAAKIALWLNKKPNAVFVGTYRGDAVFSGGPAVSKALRDKLPTHGIKVGIAGHEFIVEGDCFAERPSEQEPFAVHITSILRRKDSRMPLAQFESVIQDVQDAATLLGASVDLQAGQGDDTPRTNTDGQPATPSTKQESELLMAALEKSIQKPSVSVAQAEVTVGDGLYSLELLVQDASGNFVPRTPKLIDGLPFVSIRSDEVYQVRVRNYTKYDCGVALSIDGLSCFEFSEVAAYKKIDKWVVKAGASSEIKGWHRKNLPDGTMKISEFKVTNYADSPAAKLGSAHQIGTISATFCAAWDQRDPAPEGQLARINKQGTAMGKERIVPGEEISRLFGRQRATISIRYEKIDPPDLPSAR